MFHIICCSITQSCPTLFGPMDCCISGFPVLHHLPELAQTHVHWVGDAMQPSCTLSSPSPPAFNLFQHQGLFQWVFQWVLPIRWAKDWSFSISINPSSEYSGLISLNIDWFDLLAVQGLSGVFSSTTVQRHQFFGVVPSLQSSFHNCMWPLGRPEPWLFGPLSAEWCLCFSTHCLGLSSLSCQEAIVFWFQGCSHHLQWLCSPRRGNLSLFPLFLFYLPCQ